LEFLIYPGIYLLFLFLSYALLRSQQKRIIKQYETEKRLTELQFQNIKNQLTPHFTFNVLNSIGRMVKSGESEEAYNYLSKNSKMLRMLMNEANELTRTLNNEIKFVKDYLNLQKLRFKDRYQFKMNVDDNIDLAVLVPKMIIHTYVENAIKHGLNDLKSGGILTVDIKKVGNYNYIFEISDNGTGIKEEQFRVNNGKGLIIMDEYFKLFEDYYRYKIKTTASNLHPHNKIQPGTRIIIDLQLPSS
jgi:LytS/YehU family sensor histidine kinase